MNLAMRRYQGNLQGIVGLPRAVHSGLLAQITRPCIDCRLVTAHVEDISDSALVTVMCDDHEMVYSKEPEV
jgi:hypothetical protein